VGAEKAGAPGYQHTGVIEIFHVTLRTVRVPPA
jgi:hypothetical protein